MTVCHVPVLCADHAEKAFGGAKKKGFWIQKFGFFDAEKAFGGAKKKGFWIQTFGFFDQFWDVIIFFGVRVSMELWF